MSRVMHYARYCDTLVLPSAYKLVTQDSDSVAHLFAQDVSLREYNHAVWSFSR